MQLVIPRDRTHLAACRTIIRRPSLLVRERLKKTCDSLVSALETRDTQVFRKIVNHPKHSDTLTDRLGTIISPEHWVEHFKAVYSLTTDTDVIKLSHLSFPLNITFDQL